ncbi:MAG: gp436 family protein [Candidatus Neomarinimicrobiota bacterium]
MSYCTKADIQKRVSDQALIQLTTEDAQATEPDDDVITEAIEAADGEIDSYAVRQFTVPLSPVPPRIKDISRDIAIYNLYARRPHMETPEIIKDRYRSAVKWLEKLAEGKVSPGELPEPEESEHVGGQISQNERVFTRETMEGF